MTNAPLYLIVAMFGLVIGSFLNVVILRDGERKTIATGRSRCPHCRHELGFWDLFPLFSYLLLGGRCRYCKTPISWQYPLVEAVTAALALFCLWYGYVERGSAVLAAALFVASCLMVAVSGIDILTKEIPVEYCVAAGLIGAAAMVLTKQISWQESLLGCVAGAGIIALVIVLWRLVRHEEGMGSGDAWILGSVGALVGFPGIAVCFSAAILSGSVVGGLASVGSGRGLKSRLPFGPFIFAGALAALVWGGPVVAWYTRGL